MLVDCGFLAAVGRPVRLAPVAYPSFQHNPLQNVLLFQKQARFATDAAIDAPCGVVSGDAGAAART